MTSTALVGRAAELAQVDELLAGARKGRSGVLVLRGEAGVGKSALLAQAAESAAEFTSTRCLSRRRRPSERPSR